MAGVSVSEVRVTGALFTGAAVPIMFRFCRAAEMAVGEAGVRMIKSKLPTEYKYDPMPDNAGFYASKINTDRQIEHLTINDGDVVYGPWLEGVGSRNSPVTRFRGYHTFRLVSQELQVLSVGIAETVLPLFLEELNGI